MTSMHLMRTRKLVALGALIAGVACSGDRLTSTATPTSASIVAGTVTATRVAGGVSISNGTERAIGYAVWNPNWLGLFAPCSDPGPACLRLKPGSLVTVPLDEIAGWDAQTTDAVVYWWQVLPTSSGGFQASEVGRVPLSLRP